MMFEETELFTIREASEWASHYLKKNVTPSNISYLIQYGHIKKVDQNGAVRLRKQDLITYYNSYRGQREVNWKDQIGDDLNWALSFDYLKEAETTKHVHRLHPYKGKFIPQLVEYFLDGHRDEFKKDVYFQQGDIVLDPFCGSGTTLVQASELGMHAIGIDISRFNTLISNVKIDKYDFIDLHHEIKKITQALEVFVANSKIPEFDAELTHKLNLFNDQHFPSSDFKYRVRRGEINPQEYGREKEQTFLPTYHNLIEKYQIQLRQNQSEHFMDIWYLPSVRDEIDFVFELLKKVNHPTTKKALTVILSRTIRSCRATTHADLATLKEPITATYFCRKHGKICKPLFSILSWWKRYSKDTLKRLGEFNQLKTNTYQLCLVGDSRTIDIFDMLKSKNKEFANLARKQKINGIFSSPPYVGLIDYHEQHAYAYDLFGFERNDELEIGPLFKGKGQKARKQYITGISAVLRNCKTFMAHDYNVFLVANDKFNMYPTIAEKAGMQIVNQYKRPVLNRTEKDTAAYSEIIFHLKEK